MGAVNSVEWPTTEQVTFTYSGKTQEATCVPYSSAGKSVPDTYKGASFCKVGGSNPTIPGTYTCTTSTTTFNNGLSNAAYNTVCSNTGSTTFPSVVCQISGDTGYCNTTEPPSGGGTFVLNQPSYSSSTGVSLTWTPFPGATQYKITRADQNNNVSGYHLSTTTNFNDTELSPGDSYTYTVIVSEGAGVGTQSNPVSISIPKRSSHWVVILCIIILVVVIFIIVIVIVRSKKKPAPAPQPSSSQTASQTKSQPTSSQTASQTTKSS